MSKKTNKYKPAQKSETNEEGDDIVICPFCGKESKSHEYCASCNTRLTKEVLSVAYTPVNDPRSDMIGPFTTKTAKRLLWVLIALLLLAFIVLTEISGAGFTKIN